MISKLLIFILFISSIVFANEDVFLRDANKCLRYFSYYEKLNNIPENLLRAVSIVETKRFHKDSGIYLPWPWAVNSGGKSYYFNSKQEAIIEVKKMIDSGQKSIDVGCMQINLYHHPKAFNDLEEALEPRHNIAYGASFLKNNFTKHNNWKSAIASYHSENNEKGHPYAYKVIDQWRGNTQLTSKVNSRSSKYYLTDNLKRRRSNMIITISKKSDSFNLFGEETKNSVNKLNKSIVDKNIAFLD